MSEHLPQLSERELLELQKPDQLVDFILEHGSRVTESERLMNLAGSVLEGYGTTVEAELAKREARDGAA